MREDGSNIRSGPHGSGIAGRALAGAAALACGLAAAPVLAHPHIFIDTGLEVLFDEEGRLAAVQVVWAYDEFYSMYAIDDYGMDQEYTGSLNEDERAELADIYSNWDSEFAGDLYVYHNEAPLTLSGPLDVTADLIGGRIVITLRRAFVERVEPATAPISIQVYDPSYFTAYSIATDPVVRGRDDCSVEIHTPDPEVAEARMQEALDALLEEGADMWEIEQDFPAVGEEFAEELRVTCVQPS